jgi:hypothetical protein
VAGGRRKGPGRASRRTDPRCGHRSAPTGDPIGGTGRGRSRPPSPVPHLPRTVCLAVLDPDGCVALTRTAQDSHRPTGWGLPCRALVVDEAGFWPAAREFASELLHTDYVRWGSVSGRLPGRFTGLQDAGEATILIVRIPARPRIACPLRWIEPSRLPLLPELTGLPGIDLLISGYLEGWLPDGPVSLT